MLNIMSNKVEIQFSNQVFMCESTNNILQLKNNIENLIKIPAKSIILHQNSEGNLNCDECKDNDLVDCQSRYYMFDNSKASKASNIEKIIFNYIRICGLFDMENYKLDCLKNEATLKHITSVLNNYNKPNVLSGVTEIDKKNSIISLLFLLPKINDSLEFSLNISKNKITDLSFINSKIYNNVINLNLSNNLLVNLPDSFSNLSNLREINMSGNHITYLPKSISGMKNLVKLILSNNKIEEINLDFTCLKKLNYLDLNYNNLTYLPDNISELDNLKLLMVNYNKISNLPDSFHKLNKLTNLYLNNNNFVSYPSQLKNLQSLQKLDLSFNELANFPYFLKETFTLKTLDLSHNLITLAPDNLNQYVTQINLESNPIVKIPRKSLDEDSSLYSLKASRSMVYL